MEPDRLSRWERWGISRSSRKDVHKKSADTHPNLQAGPSHNEGLPPRFPVELRDENVIDSHPITLQCLPDGLPFPDICWLKDGEPLRTDNRVQLSCAPDGRYIMTVLGSTSGDAGRYQCVATNCAGRAVSTCYVTLAKLPRQLVRPAVTQLYPSGALVSWEDLETTGTVVYQLEMFEKEAECWQLVASDLAEPRLHVTELTPGSSYRFRVSYFSESIRGPLSAPSDEVTIPHRQQDSFKGMSLSDQKEVDGKNQNQIATSSAILSSKLQKPYTFLEERARGRFGVIRECRENSTGCTFAAKIVPASGRQEYEGAEEPSPPWDLRSPRGICYASVFGSHRRELSGQRAPLSHHREAQIHGGGFGRLPGPTSYCAGLPACAAHLASGHSL
uniref:Uncharacterized protein n=2 Tax=Eptatretus burgeri TaxID=7764 RepID=A0A8C4Q035_EPTBU